MTALFEALDHASVTTCYFVTGMALVAVAASDRVALWWISR
jgi:hypothetical protein